MRRTRRPYPFLGSSSAGAVNSSSDARTAAASPTPQGQKTRAPLSLESGGVHSCGGDSPTYLARRSIRVGRIDVLITRGFRSGSRSARTSRSNASAAARALFRSSVSVSVSPASRFRRGKWCSATTSARLSNARGSSRKGPRGTIRPFPQPRSACTITTSKSLRRRTCCAPSSRRNATGSFFSIRVRRSSRSASRARPRPEPLDDAARSETHRSSTSSTSTSPANRFSRSKPANGANAAVASSARLRDASFRKASVASFPRSFPTSTRAPGTSPRRRRSIVASSAPRYPRVSTAGANPASATSRAMYSVMGVFPVPPHVTLPTLTTGASTRVCDTHLASYAQRRMVTSRP